MLDSITKQKVLSGMSWKMMECAGTQGMQFIVQIIIARLLLPEDYGVIALVSVFIAIATVFVQSGFNTALIQKRNLEESDISSVFYLNLLVAGLFYSFLYLTVPFLAAFFDDTQFIPVLRVLSFSLFLGAINSIQYALVSREMKFKRFFFSSLGGNVFSGIIGIAMAYMGFGVWALVAQQLSNQLMITIILWFTVNWRPRLILSFERLNSLFAFGWKLLCSNLIDTIYQNVYGLVIGKVYNPEMLGYFNRGEQFPKLIVSNINGSISSVLLPALSANQDDKDKVKRIIRRVIVTSSFVIFPMMTGLAVCAEPLVMILLTEKWLPCVPFLQIMCISYAFWPIHTANLQAINSLGRSDIFLVLEIIKKCIGIAVLLISIQFSIYIMVAFMPITSLISTAINSFPNKKLLNYSFREQWLDIMPSLLLSVIMGVIIYAIQLVGRNDTITLVIQLTVGVVFYVGTAYLLKFECLDYLLYSLNQHYKGEKIDAEHQSNDINR